MSVSPPVHHLLGLGLRLLKCRVVGEELVDGCCGLCLLSVLCGNVDAAAAHDDRLVEQSACQWRLTKRANASGSGTLSEDGDVVGVASKLGNVGLDPFQRLNLVKYSIVARHMVGTLGREVRMGHEAENAQSVVDGDEHDVFRRPFLSVELWFRSPAFTIATAMNPQGHGQFLVGLSRCFGPDVQVEAVFAIGSLVAVSPFGGVEAGIVHRLIARMAELVAHADGVPRHHGLWFFPA